MFLAPVQGAKHLHKVHHLSAGLTMQPHPGAYKIDAPPSQDALGGYSGLSTREGGPIHTELRSFRQDSGSEKNRESGERGPEGTAQNQFIPTQVCLQ